MSKDIKGDGGITMIEFNKWFAQITKEYPLYQDKDGYNIGNTKALKVGWKAALEWVLKEREIWRGGFEATPTGFADDCVFGGIIEELNKKE